MIEWLHIFTKMGWMDNKNKLIPSTHFLLKCILQAIKISCDVYVWYVYRMSLPLFLWLCFFYQILKIFRKCNIFVFRCICFELSYLVRPMCKESCQVFLLEAEKYNRWVHEAESLNSNHVIFYIGALNKHFLNIFCLSLSSFLNLT